MNAVIFEKEFNVSQDELVMKVFEDLTDIEQQGMEEFFNTLPKQEQKSALEYLFHLKLGAEKAGIDLEYVQNGEPEYIFYQYVHENQREKLELLKKVARKLTTCELVTIEMSEDTNKPVIKEISAVDAFDNYFIPQERERLLKHTRYTEGEIEIIINDFLQRPAVDKENELWYQMIHVNGVFDIYSVTQLTHGNIFH